jgi:hypothetical protein
MFSNPNLSSNPNLASAARLQAPSAERKQDVRDKIRTHRPPRSYRYRAGACPGGRRVRQLEQSLQQHEHSRDDNYLYVYAIPCHPTQHRIQSNHRILTECSSRLEFGIDHRHSTEQRW